MYGVGIFPRVLRGSPGYNYMDSEPDVLRGHIGEPHDPLALHAELSDFIFQRHNDPKQLPKQVQEWFVCQRVTGSD